MSEGPKGVTSLYDKLLRDNQELRMLIDHLQMVCEKYKGDLEKVYLENKRLERAINYYAVGKVRPGVFKTREVK